MSSKPYHDEETLRGAYERLDNQKRVADEFGCHETTIVKWMKKHEIEAERTYDGEEVPCSNCGDTLERAPWRIESRDNHFCDYDCHREWQGEHTHGENNYNWVDPIEMDCEWCGTKFQFENKYEDERRFCSLDCANEWKSSSMLGEDHHNWTGGSHYWYYGSNWKDKREEVISRDTVCRCCGHDGSERRLEVHHIIPIRTFEIPEEANTLDNLLLLCTFCHGRVESGKQSHPEP